MPIEVYRDPSALFIGSNDDASKEENWMITVVAEERIRRNHPFLKIEV